MDERGALNPWLAVAEQDLLVQQALGYLNSSEVTWADLYRAVEVVQLDVGGKMHGYRLDPPKNPMTFAEADRFVRKLIREWVVWKTTP